MTSTAITGFGRLSVMDERRQFRVLYRNFLFRVIDLELLSASGDVRNLLVQFAALLAAYSFVLALVSVSHFGQSSLPHPKLIVSAWGVEEFLISTTLTVSGLFAVLAWNAILPDRRDFLILDQLPLHVRTALLAKGAAMATALGISITAINVFTGIGFPFLVVPAGPSLVGVIRSLLAYWTTMAAAGTFIFVSICALQIAAVALFPYQVFTRISGLLQLVAFFVILALFFLTPPLANPVALSSPANQHLLAWLPSFWFLGLFQELNGVTYPVFASLATRAIESLAAVGLFTLITAGLTYRRVTRRIIEQPDIAPRKRRGNLSKLTSWCASRMLNDPLDHAILLFSARTLARSRQHRLLLAVYVGMAFAISLAYAKSLVFGSDAPHWDHPDIPLLIPSLVTLFFAIIGSRAVFALPFALPANWIFRLSAVRSPAAYFSAVRKSLWTLAAVPVLLISAIFYLYLWPGRPALQHLLVLLLLAISLVQLSLRRFRKIPFACSYLPGKANLRIKFGIAAFLFLLAVDTVANIELWSMEKTTRYTFLLSAFTVLAIWATRRTAVFAGSTYNRVQFEDTPPAEIYALDFRRDSGYSNDEVYLNTLSSPAARSFASRIKRCTPAKVIRLFSHR